MKSEREVAGLASVAEIVPYDFGLTRRSFAKLLGGGLMLAVSALSGDAQESGQRSRGGFLGTGARNLAARIHLGTDGSITVLCGKVEGGQGARTEITQAAAEELRVPVGSVELILADTSLVPDDGMTAGSGTTPRTVPAVRQGAAAARNLLISYACAQWSLQPASLEVRDGRVVHANARVLSYADLARSAEAARQFQQAIPSGIELTQVRDWKVLGTPALRPNARAIVTGKHEYPSDITRPGMLYGKVLRPPSYGARLTAIDAAPAKAIKDVIVIQDEQFVGVAAANSSNASKALEALSATAKWADSADPHPSSSDLIGYLRSNAEGGVPANPFADVPAAKSLHRSYFVPYIQHAPLEPRAAVAEWTGGKLTVWTGSQNPFGVHNELARAFHLSDDSVRVIIPDFGGAFGGKHTGECAIEAARLAKAAGRPVSLRWSRQEEFTWAYFRPAAVIEAEASLDEHGRITAWHFVNINSGPNAVDAPYSIAKKDCRFIPSKPPLRHGSYRGLAATANNFAREVFMDELAAAAGADPLEFRLAHLEDPRLRAVLQKAATEFRWPERSKQKDAAIGLACGVEKGSYVAACAEIALDRPNGTLKVSRICQAYECGAILNPANLLSQVQGAITMGLGAALREEIGFENGKILNGSFGEYLVPRFADVPEMEVHLIDRPDLASAGAGETPIIVIAPAIANAVFRATGSSVASLPIRLKKTPA
ncbi:MAG: xanthine dehydrogenase family protein molybdopterin-binding subunit [Silvibacterium sp.]|nr:xanthine dehydrogenase family protein molybdopterin-binding subunit [Silvibacterium sp.]